MTGAIRKLKCFCFHPFSFSCLITVLVQRLVNNLLDRGKGNYKTELLFIQKTLGRVHLLVIE